MFSMSCRFGFSIFPKQCIDAAVKRGVGAFHAFGVGAQSFEHAKRMKLAVVGMSPFIEHNTNMGRLSVKAEN